MSRVLRVVGTVVGVALFVVGTVTGNVPLAMLGTKIATMSNLPAGLIDIIVPPPRSRQMGSSP